MVTKLVGTDVSKEPVDQEVKTSWSDGSRQRVQGRREGRWGGNGGERGRQEGGGRANSRLGDELGEQLVKSWPEVKAVGHGYGR